MSHQDGDPHPEPGRRFASLLLTLLAPAVLWTIPASGATNLYIASSLAAAQAAGMTGSDTSASASGPLVFQASGAVPDSVVLVSSLESALAGNDVLVTAANADGTGFGNVIVVDPVTWPTLRTLTLEAESELVVRAALSATLGSIVGRSGPADFPFPSKDLWIIGATVSSASGSISLSSPSNEGAVHIVPGTSFEALVSAGGGVTLTAGPAGQVICLGTVRAGSGRIVVTAGISLLLAYSGVAGSTGIFEATGSNSTPVADGGQISIDTGGLVLGAKDSIASRLSTTDGAIRIRTAQPVFVQGSATTPSAETMLSAGGSNGHLRIESAGLILLGETGSGAAGITVSGSQSLGIALSGMLPDLQSYGVPPGASLFARSPSNAAFATSTRILSGGGIDIASSNFGAYLAGGSGAGNAATISGTGPLSLHTPLYVTLVGSASIAAAGALDLKAGKTVTIGAGSTVSSTQPGTLVVDDENPTRPARSTDNMLVNNGTLDLGTGGRVFAVGPGSVALGSWVPVATKLDVWFGEAGAVAGINYKEGGVPVGLTTFVAE